MPSLSGYQSKQSQAAVHAKRSAPTGACAFAGLSPVARIDAVANYEMKEGPPKGLRVEALSVPTNCDSVPQELGRSGRRHRPHDRTREEVGATNNYLLRHRGASGARRQQRVLRRECERVKRGGDDKTTNLPVSACYDWAAFCRDWGCAWAVLEVSAKVECMFL
jgi:hypothetical protein